MKKTLLMTIAALWAITSWAQTTPQITLTAEVDNMSRTFNIGSAVDNNTISVDWGDGNIIEVATVGQFDGYTTTDVIGTPLAGGQVKIYTTGALSYFEAVSKVGEAGITDIDVSKATQLTHLYVNGNKLKALDLSNNVALTRLYVNNNSLTSLVLSPSVTYVNAQNNSLERFDASVVPNLTYLNIASNKLTSLDLSANHVLANLFAQDNQMTTFVLGRNETEKLSVNVSGNQLTSLDLIEATGLGTAKARLFAQNNKLSQIKYSSLTTANLSGNSFTLSTLPRQNIATLTYAPQQPMEIVSTNGVVDLSGEYMIDGQATTFAWYKADGTAISASDYVEEAGKFTFNQNFESAYCVLSNAVLPKFADKNAFRTSAVAITSSTTGISMSSVAVPAKAVVYRANGTLVGQDVSIETLGKGMYIVKHDGKTIKIVR